MGADLPGSRTSHAGEGEGRGEWVTSLDAHACLRPLVPFLPATRQSRRPGNLAETGTLGPELLFFRTIEGFGHIMAGSGDGHMTGEGMIQGGVLQYLRCCTEP